MQAKAWTCSKKSCQAKNPPRTRKCWKCGKLKPPKKYPDHMRGLHDYTYEDYIKINGGEFCWICKELGIAQYPNPPKRYQRDHDHFTGEPRGLLCYRHNRWLSSWITPEFLMAAKKYLTRKKIVL